MTELVSDAPDLEDLAAYLDGSLSDERRALVEERLARDEDYYDVFVETVRFQEEQSQEEDSAKVIAPSWFRNWKTIAPIAVAATLVTALGLQSLAPKSPLTLLGDLDSEAIVTSSADQWHRLGWRRLRGSSDSLTNQELIYEEEHCFRIGTRIVDLDVALAANDRKSAQEVTSELVGLIDRVVVLGSFYAPYKNLYSKIEGNSSDSLRQRATDLTGQIVELLPDSHAKSFELGVWNEIGRLAARANDAKVLKDVWKRRRSAPNIKTKIRPHYDALEQALESEDDIDFKAAEAVFQEIAKSFAGSG